MAQQRVDRGGGNEGLVYEGADLLVVLPLHDSCSGVVFHVLTDELAKTLSISGLLALPFVGIHKSRFLFGKQFHPLLDTGNILDIHVERLIAQESEARW